MRTSQVLGLTTLLVSVFMTGCASRRPLATLPPEQRTSVHVTSRMAPGVKEGFSSVGGRHARNAGAMGGLLGMAIGSVVAADHDKGGSNFVAEVRKSVGVFEAEVLREKFHALLLRTGIPTDPASGNRLLVELTSLGITEVQPGFFAPYASCRASLTGAGTWSARAYSQGTVLRVRDDFSSKPELYREDFAGVAADLAHQLVEGPIR